MLCPKCSRLTLPEEHINETGKLYKLCYRCLRKEKISNVFHVNFLEELTELLCFPFCVLMISMDFSEEQTLKDLVMDVIELIWMEKKVKYR